MAKLLQLGRPSKGVSNVVRAWLIARQQRRRRARNATKPLVIPAPVITNGQLVTSEVNPLWQDAIVWFAFDSMGLPTGELAVQGCVDVDYPYWEDRFSVPVGAGQFRDDMVFAGQNIIHYRMRFVSGELTGPWSGEYQVTV